MVEDKIITALEKISNVMKGLLWNVAKEEKVSPLQIQFLLFISSCSRKEVKVGDVAREFGLTDATTSDSLSTLVEKGFLRKERDARDSRKVYVRLTDRGKELVRRVKRWRTPIRNLLRSIDKNNKEELLFVLMEIMRSFQEKGLVEEARVCLACEHLVERDEDGRVFLLCSLTGVRLSISDLKVDCNSFEGRKKK